MSKEYRILGKKYKQLTEAECGQIEAYMSRDVYISEIARRLNRSKSTI